MAPDPPPAAAPVARHSRPPGPATGGWAGSHYWRVRARLGSHAGAWRRHRTAAAGGAAGTGLAYRACGVARLPARGRAEQLARQAGLRLEAAWHTRRRRRRCPGHLRPPRRYGCCSSRTPHARLRRVRAWPALRVAARPPLRSGPLRAGPGWRRLPLLPVAAAGPHPGGRGHRGCRDLLLAAGEGAASAAPTGWRRGAGQATGRPRQPAPCPACRSPSPAARRPAASRGRRARATGPGYPHPSPA